jgi:hypothetical protein
LVRRAIVVTALVADLALASCSAEPDAAPSSAVPSSVAESTATSTPPTGSGGPALAAALRLTVKGRAPLTGYDRAQFGQAWTDDNDDPLGHNGCDTRNDVLRRDLTDVQLKPTTHECVVLTGELADPYTGRPIAFVRGVRTSARVQIDHVVALADAWQTGAQQWSARRRTDFANDPLNLLAVDGPTNEQKGASDAASWLPPDKAFRCRYVARQVAVKTRYRLAVTAAERAAFERVLQNCGDAVAPTETGTPPA